MGFVDDLEFNPGGLGVLWAEENTRDALFAAMQRREAYGTSGTRPVVRFFGGWDYPGRPVRAATTSSSLGYARGVPMGGELPERPDAAAPAPRFALSRPCSDPGVPPHRTGHAAPAHPDREGLARERRDVKERVVDVAGGENGASVDTAHL